MPGALHPDLERLLDFYAKRRAAPPEPFAHAPGLVPSLSFFSVASLQQHLNNPLLTPNWIALVSRGEFVPLEPAYMYKDVQNKELFFMDKELIDRHLAQGAALLLEGLDILDPAINEFTARVDAGLPCALTNPVAFFSQRGNEAYKGHADRDDVLVIHIDGEKTWSLFEPRPRKLQDKGGLTPAQMGRRIAEIVMRPGDALYLRAGTPHVCQTTGKFSLHVSFDMRDRTPSIARINEEAMSRYYDAAAEQYAPGAAVIEKYLEVLKNDQFKRDVDAATANVRNQSLAFRNCIGKSAVVHALDRFVTDPTPASGRTT